MMHNKPITESTLKSNAFTETDDAETAPIRNVIDAAELKWGGSSSVGGHAGEKLGSHYGIRPLEGEVPPPGYVCRICHIPGHFIQHCPSESKPPPPGYVCYKCGVPGHFIHCCPNYGDRKYDSRRSCSLIPIVSSFADGHPTEFVQAMSGSIGDSMPAELHCPLCKKVMTDAMLTSKCCYDSFCDKCIRGYIVAQSKCICGVQILADDLIPNQTLRSTIASMLSSIGGGFSIGTEKLASSSSSTFDANAHSFTASVALKLDMKQHLDNTPSVITEGNCLITACKNPADPLEKLTHSDLQNKTRESAKTPVKKTVSTIAAMKTVPEPRYQKQSPPDGITIVSGALEGKVGRTKSGKKQKKAGTAGNGNTKCAEYECHVPFELSCYNFSVGFGGLPWGAAPYNMYFMPNMPASNYPMGLYNVNGIGNLPQDAPGMQGYPVSHYSREFQPSVHQDREASMHAVQAESKKGVGLERHKSERYYSCTSIHKGGSRSRSRSVLEIRDSSFESYDYDEEFHSRKKVREHHATSLRDGSQHRSALDGSFESCDYDEEFHIRKKVRARPANASSPRDDYQHRSSLEGSYESRDYDEQTHGRKKARAHDRSRKSNSRHSNTRQTYDYLTSSDEEPNFKRRW